MPSATDLIFVGLLCVLVFTSLSVHLLGDAGIGWHIRAGQQILATHAIPGVDSFSSTMGGRPWFAWEWLYDAVAGWLESHLGLNGVVWLTAAVIAATFAWLFRLLVARGTNILVALVLLLLAVSASMIHFLARPHVVSWLLTVAWFWILDSSERDNLDNRGGRSRRQIWALPLLMLVWVNVHGGFLIGFALLGIFLAGAASTWFRAKEGRIEEALQKIAAGKQVRTLSLISLLSAVAGLVNPYGWNLYTHIYHYLSNRFLMDHIDEFHSPDFHGVAQKCFLGLLLITIVVLILRGRELRFSQGLTVLFAVYAGLYASRNIPISSILLVMVIGPLVPANELMRTFSDKMVAVELALRGHVWPILTVFAVLAIAVNGGRVRSSVWMNAHFDARRMPVDAVNYIEKQEIHGPILSEDYWGGYLIYRLYPKAQVVVDDRHDLYGEQFFKAYLKMIRAKPGWDEFLQEHEASCILLPSDAPLANVLILSNAWKEIYADDVAIAFERDVN
jgi:hypothetical protein